MPDPYAMSNPSTVEERILSDVQHHAHDSDENHKKTHECLYKIVKENENMDNGSNALQMAALMGSRRDDNYRYDSGGGTGGAGGIFGGIIGGAIGGRLFGDRDCRRDGDGTKDLLISQNLNGRFDAVTSQIQCGDDALQRGLFHQGVVDAVRNVGDRACNIEKEIGTVGLILANQMNTGFKDVALESCRQTGTLAATILENRYQQALLAKDAAAEAFKCCCETKEAIHMEGEKTRELINAQALATKDQRINELLWKNNNQESNSAITNINFGIQALVDAMKNVKVHA